MAPSKDYFLAIEESKQHHASSKTYSGKLMRPHAGVINALIHLHGGESLLDYGCGKGSQYKWVADDNASIPKGMTIPEYWGVPITLYDPAYPPFAKRPEGHFDIVICTHTLGVIPAQDHGYVISDIYGFAKKAVYIAEQVETGPSKENPRLHPAGRPRSYWEHALRSVPHDGLDVWLSTREKTPRGTVTTRSLI
jgi:hypothetical protein